MNMAASSPLPPPAAPSLSFAIRMFAEEAISPGTAAGLRKVASQLDQGADWSEAIQAGGRRLPRFLRGVLAIAERTGSIGQVITEYFAGSRRTRLARRRVLATLFYPVFLLLVTMLLVIGILLFLVPQFRDMYLDFGIPLPITTRMVVSSSDFVVHTWQWLLLGLAMAAGLFLLLPILARQSIAAPAVRLLQTIPLLGTASQLAAASEFCVLLGIVVRARIPLPDALRLTAGGLRDSNLREGCLKLARQVEQGESPAYAASILPNFPERIVQLLRHHDHEESFGEILRSHAELFALQAEAQAGIAIVWMQPFLLLMVGMIGGFIVIGLFAPLIDLMDILG